MAVKRRKNKHKMRMRSSTKLIILVFFGILAFVSLTRIIANIWMPQREEHDEITFNGVSTFKQENKAVIKKNKYMENEELKLNQPVITDLVQSLNVNYNYVYEAPLAEQINVTYKVKGILKSNYSTNGNEEEIWNKEYVLLEEKTASSESNSIQIDENLEIDINKYDDLVKDFIDEVQIAISSKMCVVFEANITAYVKDEMVLDNYSNEMEVTVGDKVSKISGNFEDSKENKKTQKVETVQETNYIEVISWSAILLLSIYVIMKVQRNTRTTRRIVNVFKQDLNQILSTCGDKIIKVDSKSNIHDNNAILVKDINELVKLSEEAFKPILYYQVPNAKEAWFYVVLENEVYRYILK